jgi:hypothetical protein
MSMIGMVQLELLFDLLSQDSLAPLAPILQANRKAAEYQLAPRWLRFNGLLVLLADDAYHGLYFIMRFLPHVPNSLLWVSPK